MKKLWLLALVSWLPLLGGDPSPGGQLSFPKEIHDFGIVDKGEKVSTAFAFTNAGQGELEILEVKTSCGCTSAQLTKTVYKPGEQGEIPITFDSSKFDGAVQKTITVVSNDAAVPRRLLRIKGEVQAEVQLNPPHFTIYDVKRDEDFEGFLEVTTSKLARLEISDLYSNIPFLQMTPVRKDDQNLVIKLAFSGGDLPKDSDSVRGGLTFKTNSAKLPRITSQIAIKVASAVQVDPRSVNLFGVPKGNSREVTVALRPTQPGALTILKAESDLDFIKVEPIAKGLPKLKVTLADTAANGSFSGTITVETNLDEQPQIRIPVRGSVL